MSKKSIIERNEKRKKMFFLSLKKKTKLNKKNKIDKFFINILPKNSSITRIRRRCYITGKPRGVFRKFGISRNIIREKVLNGEIPGAFKLSW